MDNQFSQKASDIIIYNKGEANRLRSNYIGPEHLLLGTLRDNEGKAIEISPKLKTSLTGIKKQIEAMLKKHADDMLLPGADVPLSNGATKILKLCILETRVMKSQVADTEHVLLAILKDKDDLATTVLEANHVDYQQVFEQLSLQPDISVGMGFTGNDDDEDEMSQSRSTHGTDEHQRQAQTTSRKPTNDIPALDNFGTDMTKMAGEGRLDPVVGREREIERLAQILSHRKKNNPILTDEPGVGKSAIMRGSALRIIQEKVSRILFDKHVVALDMTTVVAGTKYRERSGGRIRSILNELQRNLNVILFIDEIHIIVGAGSTAGSTDAANMLRPALIRGEIQCIGATTLDGYRRNIEKNGTLERCFQKVMAEPTTARETLRILRNIKNKYGDHHNVNYTDAALEACVKLTDRYITDRNLPDKAIDALDETGSRVYLTDVSVLKEIGDQGKLIEEAKNKKNDAVKSRNFKLAANFRDKERELTTQLDVMKKKWEGRLKDNCETIDAEEIANVISMMSGIPVQKIVQAEGVKLAGIKEDLQLKVIAQNAAIEKLMRAILRSRAGLRGPNRPIGTLMFLGPTGVGKTHLAKGLAKYMPGSSDALIRIDMNEYTEKFTVSRLAGTPPGYVRYEEGGQLTEKVRRKPCSIVLLDEIEKAHPNVFNPLFQVMDEGRLTGSYGKMVDFKNMIIIMTSDVGTRQLKEFGRGVGFVTQSRLDGEEFSRSVIRKTLNKSLAPEFLNRVDEIITFDQLSLEVITKIIDIELKGSYDRIGSIDYKLVIENKAKQFIVPKGYDVQYGARPLERVIQAYLGDGLSEPIISASLKEGDTVTVSLNEGKGELEMNHEAKTTE